MRFQTLVILGGLAAARAATVAFAQTPTTAASAGTMPAAPATAAGPATAAAEVAVRAQIDRYLTSIDRADTALAAQVWSPTPDVIFIHPRGTERGWAQVAKNFYGATMGDLFTERRLRPVGHVVVQTFGNTALAVFQWDFVATFRQAPPGMGPVLNTQGRETQLYANVPGQGWRLVQVHYSGLPVGGAGRGF